MLRVVIPCPVSISKIRCVFPGSDYINGNQDNDVVSGDSGNDTLRGGKGNDLLDGGDGDDVLVGDLGTDTLIGGLGEDVFVLRPDEAGDDPSKIDLISDFDKTSDLIGLGEGLTEADLTLETTSLTIGSSDTLIRLSATGAILGAVKGALPEDLKDRFTVLEAKPDIPEDVVTFAAPSVTQVAADTWAMVLRGSDGSEFTIAIKNTGDRVYQESLTYTPSISDRSSGAKSFTALTSPEGDRIEVQFENSANRWIAETTENDSVTITRKTGDGRDDVLIPLPVPPTVSGLSEAQQGPAGEADRPLCKAGRDICKAVETIGAVAGGLSAFTFLTGVGAVASGPLGAITLAAKLVNWSCVLLFGSDSEFAAELAGELGGKLLRSVSGAKLFGRASFKDIFSNGLKRLPGPKALLERPGGEKTLQDFVDDAIGDLGEKIGEKVFDLSSSLLTLSGTVPKTGGVLPSIRKSLGLYFCDKPPSTPPLTPPLDPAPEEPQERFFDVTLTPTDIPYQQTATLTVGYFNPDNNSERVDITGSSFKGLGLASFEIPEDKRSGGELTFTITNVGHQLGGDCSQNPLGNGSFINATIYNEGGGLFESEQIEPVHLTGGVASVVFPCVATVTPLF